MRTKNTLWMMLAACSLGSAVAAWSPVQDWTQYNGPHHDRAATATLASASWSEAAPAEVWRTPTRLGFSSFCIGTGGRTRWRTAGNKSAWWPTPARAARPLWTSRLAPADYEKGGHQGTDDNKGGDGPRSTPAYAAGRVYVLDTRLALTCIDASNGQLRWRVDLPDDHAGRELKWGNAASPVVEEGKVIVAGGGPGQSFLAFSTEDGSLLWKNGDEHYTHATPTMATLSGVRQVIFLVQSGVVSLDVEDGRELWRSEYPYRVSSAASPVVWEDMVYVSAGYGVGGGTFRVSRSDSGDWNAELLWAEAQRLDEPLEHGPWPGRASCTGCTASRTTVLLL